LEICCCISFFSDFRGKIFAEKSLDFLRSFRAQYARPHLAVFFEDAGGRNSSVT
jgi:hypothetical protein